jgi:hypothetical protein
MVSLGHSALLAVSPLYWQINVQSLTILQFNRPIQGMPRFFGSPCDPIFFFHDLSFTSLTIPHLICHRLKKEVRALKKIAKEKRPHGGRRKANK